MHIRSTSKRSRSPSSPPPGREPKRVLLSQDAVQTTGFIPESNNLWNGTRQSLVEDEWVDQARGLTIHSPALGNDERIRSIQNNAEGCGRTDVQMDNAMSQESPSLHLRNHERGDGNSMRTTPSTWNSAVMASSSSHESRLSHVTFHHSSFVEQSTSQLKHESLRIPSASLQESPTNNLASDRYFSRRVSRSGQTPSLPDAMAVDSQPIATSKPSTQKKRSAVSMGPRTDCEKCRAKVPNHWMHYD